VDFKEIGALFSIPIARGSIYFEKGPKNLKNFDLKQLPKLEDLP